MKKKSKDQRWRWICAGSLLLASLSGNLEASGLSHPDVNPMEVSQTVRKLRGTILDTEWNSGYRCEYFRKRNYYRYDL